MIGSFKDVPAILIHLNMKRQCQYADNLFELHQLRFFHILLHQLSEKHQTQEPVFQRYYLILFIAYFSP